MFNNREIEPPIKGPEILIEEIKSNAIAQCTAIILDPNLSPAEINYTIEAIINKVIYGLEIDHDGLRETRDKLNTEIEISEIAIKSLMSKLPSLEIQKI